MGTFNLRLTVLSAVDVDLQLDFPSVGTDAYFVGLNLGGASTPHTDGIVTYIAIGDCMYLDGSATPINVLVLPIGFKLGPSLGWTLKNYMNGAWGTEIGRLWKRLASLPGDYARVISQKGTWGPTTQSKLGSDSIGAHAIQPFIVGPSETIDFFTALTLNLIVTDAALFTSVALRQLEFTGFYTLITWSWQFSGGTGFSIPGAVPAQTGQYFSPGARFEIASGGGVDGNVDNIYSDVNPNGTGIDLKGTSGSDPIGAGSGNGVASVIFSWVDPVTGPDSEIVLAADFEDWTWFFFWFYLPDDLPTGVYIDVSVKSTGFPDIPAPIGTGTQFSGSVKLGTIKILGTEASGIYKIVAGKTNDTLYVDSPTSDDTVDFAFPDPFAKTGFVGG